LVGSQWLTDEEIKAAGLAVAQTDYYGEAADGEIYGTASLYSNARASSDATDTAGSSARVGQQYDSSQYYCYRAFFSFDTSGIDDAHQVVSATFYAKAYLDQSATDFQVQLYRYAWAEPLGTYQEANYDGAYGAGATLEALSAIRLMGGPAGRTTARAWTRQGSTKAGTRNTRWYPRRTWTTARQPATSTCLSIRRMNQGPAATRTWRSPRRCRGLRRCSSTWICPAK
jgi:hypothetical protein